MRLIAAATTILLVMVGPAYADSVNAHATSLSAADFPTNVAFKADTAVGGCAVGQWLYFNNANIDTMRAAYSTVMAAIVGGRPLVIYYSTTACIVTGLVIQ